MDISNDSCNLSGFPPVINAQTHTLILGSFPGVASLEARQYYAYQHNQFWRLISAVTGEDMASLTYEDRLPRLLAHGFGLWDVIDTCHRKGSLDTNIRNAQANEFAWLREHYPALQRMAFNGKTSGKFAPQFAALGFTTVILPSSSPANAMRNFEEKLIEWKQLQSNRA